MKTYRITAFWEGNIGWDSTSFEMDFAQESAMQHYVERMGTVGVWDQDEDKTFLVPPNQVRRIVVEVVDE